jgi:hypothetical protein
MQLFKYFLAVIAAVFLALGCKSVRPAADTTVKEVVSVDTYTQERDTTIITPPSTVAISIPLENVKTGFNSGLNRHSNAKVVASVNDGKINIVCTCDTLAIAAKLRDQFKKEIKHTNTKETIVVPEPFTPWPILALAWIGGGGLLLIVISLILKRYTSK